MTTNSRKAIESPLEQGTTELRAYQFDTALIDSSILPTSPTDVLYNETQNDRDVSSTLLTGTLVVSGTNITTRSVQNLVKDNVYRHVVEWGPVTDRASAYWQLYGTL